MRTGPELKPRKRYANDGTFLGILHHAVKKHVPPASEWLQIAQLDAAVKGGGGGGFWVCGLLRNFASIGGC